MGLSNSVVSLGRVVGPLYAGIVFDINPSLPYISGALILFAVFIMSLIWVKPRTGEVPAPLALQ